MSNEGIMIIVLLCAGLGYIRHRLNGIEEIMAMSIALQLGKVIVKDATPEEKDDDRSI